MASFGTDKGSSAPFRARVEKIQTITANATLAAEASVVFAAAAEGATLTLPKAAEMKGRSVKVVNTGAAGAIVVDGDGTETINGATTFTLTDQYDFVEVVSNGTAWFVVGRYLDGDFGE